MSDREFENYLNLLAGLLRLSGKQRETIARELRSHLEERLDELMASGAVGHEDAVKQALAEFGDAAGLARQFGAISWGRKRRWLMRLMTFSVAATLLLAASLVIFWPGRNAAPGRATVVAQVPAAADPNAPRAGGAEGPTEPQRMSATKREHNGSPARTRIEAELGKETAVDFVEQPLKDVVLYISELHKIPIYIRKKKLDEATVRLDKPVTITLRGVSLKTALDLMLDELELTYIVKDVLIITTPEDEESNLETRVYDCRDLLDMPAAPGADLFVPRAAAFRGMGGMFSVDDQPEKAARSAAIGSSRAGSGSAQESPQTELERRTDDLIDLVTATVKPDSWDHVGGPGAISAYNGLFAVAQTAKVHEQVEHVFDMLREAAGLQAAKGAKVVR